ncbi:MAG: alpha/beta hydrolase [Actinocatenispora sp.]
MAFPHRVGDGEHRVLVLHGWFGPGESWQALLPHLDPTAFTYAFLDYRGYGSRRGEAGEYTVEEIARDALATADELGWREFSLVGHSMGGMAMQKVYALAPERVRRMVGVSPVPASGVPFDERAWGLFSSAAGSPENRRRIINASTGGRRTDAWLDEMVRRSVETSDVAAFAAYLPSWAHGDFHEEVKGSAVPVKVVVGAHDAAITAELARATFGLWYPNFELAVLDDAGHYPMDEAPVELAGEIERFLAT